MEDTFKGGEEIARWDLVPLEQGKRLPPYIPPKATKRYNEAYAVINKSPSSAAIQARACLDLLLRARWEKDDPVLSKKINKSGLSLVQRAEIASEKLGPEWKNRLDAVRMTGNNAAHPSPDDLEDVEKEDAEVVLRAVELVIDEWDESKEKTRKETEFEELTTRMKDKQKAKKAAKLSAENKR